MGGPFRLRASECGGAVASVWAPEGDEADGVAGRDTAADGLHGAAIQEVGDGLPAVAAVVIEQALELRRAGVVVQAFAGVVSEADDLVGVRGWRGPSAPRPWA